MDFAGIPASQKSHKSNLNYIYRMNRKADLSFREQDYDPFGMKMEGRNWDAGSEYRYGFQGQEIENHDDSELYSFEFRIHDPKLGRFLSLDPLGRNYPHNSPYAFCENRVIDGIDLEGSEYITYTVRVTVNNAGGVLIDICDYRGAADFDYTMHSESFGPEGKGIKYIYEYENEAGKVYKTETMWEMPQSDLASSLGNHGLFMGSGSITYCGPLWDPELTSNDYNFSEVPIDGVDGVAYSHDVAASEISNYQGWLEDSRTIWSDRELIKGFDSYIRTHTPFIGRGQLKVKGRVVDPVTGRPASYEALFSASTGSIFFNVVTRYKEWKIETLKSMDLDPFAVENQGKVTLDMYKIDASQYKWFEVGKKFKAGKRNAEYEILKSASSQTSSS